MQTDDMFVIPPEILMNINNPDYKPIFVKFIGKSTYCFVNFDLLKALSTFFNDLNSEIPIHDQLNINVDNDEIVKYIGKIFNYKLTFDDKKYLFDNRKLLHLLYNEFDKYNMSTICKSIVQKLIIPVNYESMLNIYEPKCHDRFGYPYKYYIMISFLIILYDDLTNLSDILTNEMKSIIRMEIKYYLDFTSPLAYAREKECSYNCNMCLLKRKFIGIKRDLDILIYGVTTD